MAIWVDADACPKPVKEILFRAAQRARVELTLVANQMLAVPGSPWIRALQVPRGFDVADDEIVRRVAPGDLVVTADIPLAAAVIAKGARVITPRGETYDAGSIAAALTLRNFMDTLRSSGVETGGPAAFGAGDQREFARRLERYLVS
ncbi:MAG: YaiI/YqxD family protein [Pseudomonadota bacterium]